MTSPTAASGSAERTPASSAQPADFSDAHGAWRVSYQPGEWTLLSGPSAVVVLEPAPGRASVVVNRIWELALSASGPDDLVSRLSGVGLDAMPNLALVFRDAVPNGDADSQGGPGLRALLRGDVRLTDGEGRDLGNGSGVRTWREVELASPVVEVHLPMGERSDDQLTLPMLTGAARAGWVRIDVSRGALPDVAPSWVEARQEGDQSGQGSAAVPTPAPRQGPDDSLPAPAAGVPNARVAAEAAGDVAGTSGVAGGGQPADTRVGEGVVLGSLNDAEPVSSRVADGPDEARPAAGDVVAAGLVAGAAASVVGLDEGVVPVPVPPVPVPPVPVSDVSVSGGPVTDVPASDVDMVGTVPPLPSTDDDEMPPWLRGGDTDRLAADPQRGDADQPQAPDPDDRLTFDAQRQDAAESHEPEAAEPQQPESQQPESQEPESQEPAEPQQASESQQQSEPNAADRDQWSASDPYGADAVPMPGGPYGSPPAWTPMPSVPVQQDEPGMHAAAPLASALPEASGHGRDAHEYDNREFDNREFDNREPDVPESSLPPVYAELHTSAGDRILVTGPVLIGRAPAPRGGLNAQLLRVPSPSQDISRTHLLVDAPEGQLEITDLHSTNGTIITSPDGATWRLGAGVPVSLELGTIIDLGDGVTIDVAPHRSSMYPHGA